MMSLLLRMDCATLESNGQTMDNVTALICVRVLALGDEGRVEDWSGQTSLAIVDQDVAVGDVCWMTVDLPDRLIARITPVPPSVMAIARCQLQRSPLNNKP